MSFSDTVREEVNQLFPKQRCCQRAFFNGMLMSAKTDGDSVVISLRDAQSVGHFRQCLLTFCKTEPEETQINRGFCHMTALKFTSDRVAKTMALYDEGENTSALVGGLFKCPHCHSAFIRGMLCASGSVSDPVKEYCLEFVLPTRARAELANEIFGLHGVSGGFAKRRADVGLYFHNYDTVWTLLLLAGANKSSNRVSDAQIEKEIRNQENAYTNYITHNIQRTVEASKEPINAVEALIASDMLSELDESLRTTAYIRIQNGESSLQELGQLHTPPISKSTVRYRLTRIVEFARGHGLLDN